MGLRRSKREKGVGNVVPLRRGDGRGRVRERESSSDGGVCGVLLVTKGGRNLHVNKNGRFSDVDGGVESKLPSVPVGGDFLRGTDSDLRDVVYRVHARCWDLTLGVPCLVLDSVPLSGGGG